MDRALQGHPRLTGALAEWACPLVTRQLGDSRQVLAFRHPLAGRQFVKGSIEPPESAADAAIRELAEKSGIRLVSHAVSLGAFSVGEQVWYFVDCRVPALPDRWQHWTRDGGGLQFEFFWHPLDQQLNSEWDAIFHEAFVFIRQLLEAD
ncbi:NUDIX domain-containing protein [Paracoccus aurantiacus]|uniref:NUDIX domain-containing protein n=1 Tax=Paracoccus aurantiacus TaxID=2599412 RepID=A0A5C6S6P4_9RHOB|nr:NUDIX domain-containing protein [Paracoccus aurantiacus]TXB69721.1 NUDIX domain-containing protein [Paracoccus aurantiacus]